LNIQGKTGFLSNVGDVEDMAKNALYILDEAHLQTFRTNALNRAKEFDSNHIVPMYIAYYQEVLDKCHSSVK
jgi:glycosyltransferase involved in cell wall biosynthesis